MEAKHGQTRNCPHHWHMQPSVRAVNMRKQTRKRPTGPDPSTMLWGKTRQPQDTCWHTVHRHSNTNTQETLFSLTSCESPQYLNKKLPPSQTRSYSENGVIYYTVINVKPHWQTFKNVHIFSKISTHFTRSNLSWLFLLYFRKKSGSAFSFSICRPLTSLPNVPNYLDLFSMA